MDDSRTFIRPLCRVNALLLGLSVATLSALAIWLVTMIVVIKGGPPHIDLLAEYLPGYTVSPSGAFLGAGWGFVLGFLFSAPAAWFYYWGILRHVTAGQDEPSDAALGSEVARLQIPEFPAAAGMLAGVLILLASVLLVINHRPGEPLGPHLGLLTQYLPGYRVSIGGGLIGFLYFLVLGALGSACIGWIYNRLVSPGRGNGVASR